MSGFTIAIEDQGTLRKITKIVPYKSGGFAVLAPYHEARQGFLAKYPVDYSKRDLTLRRVEYVARYSAEDRVKLSLHSDGFVQFSGENPGKIVSGRDSTTGEPKGLGLVTSHPYADPIKDGPTFGSTVWGLSDFKPVRGGASDVITFSTEDLYYRRCTPDTWNGYLIEGFVFPDTYWGGVRNRGGRLTMTLLASFEAPGTLFEFRVIPLPGQPYLIGLLVSRLPTSFPSSSGFVLNSPSDGKNTLMAVYPARLDDPPSDTLNYG